MQEGKMIHKRPLGGENSYEISCKYQRQSEASDLLAPFMESAHIKDAPPPLKLQTSDGSQGEEGLRKCEDEGRFTSDMCKDCEASTSGSVSNFWWFNASPRSGAVAHSSFSPEYFELGNLVRGRDNDIYTCIEYPSRQLVSVGPEHQAYVPEWGFQYLSRTVDGFNGEKWLGTCIISMPDPETENYGCEEGRNRIECKCLNRDSVQCVRQHIIEAREELRENLGLEVFERLGFCEMGEEIERKWTVEEEQTFLDVVANQGSTSNGLWDHLSAAFPSRMHKELVSYYFNVFMLRKRAKQNRIGPLNIDSDNDSVVESPANQDHNAYHKEYVEENFHKENEEEEDTDVCKEEVNLVVPRFGTDEENCGDIHDIRSTFGEFSW